MTNEEAYSWITQPGIQATLFRFDRQTNEALRQAIEALKAQDLQPTCNRLSTYSQPTHSRQAVIDAIDTVCDRECKYSKKQRDVMCDACVLGSAIEVIEDMPSAEPDIIACGDCKHYICHDRRCGYWNHGVKPLMWCSQAERRTDDKSI